MTGLPTPQPWLKLHIYSIVSPYVGKDESRSGDVSVPTDIVMKLTPLFKNDHNVRSDNYYTSLDFWLCLQNKLACS